MTGIGTQISDMTDSLTVFPDEAMVPFVVETDSGGLVTTANYRYAAGRYLAKLSALAANGGAALIGTSGGITAQAALDARPTSATLAASGGADLIGFIQDGVDAVARTLQAKNRDIVSVKDFGVDGSGDDTAGMLAAITYQQSSGCILQGLPGETITLSTWVAPTLTSPFYYDGNGGTVTCGNATKVAFVTTKAATMICNTTFTDWYRIVSNPPGTTGTLSGFWFYDNVITNTLSGADNFAYPILLQNAGVENVFIHDNIFTTVKVAAVLIGDDVLASQPNRNRIFIANNVVDGVTITTGPTQLFGIIVYGSDVLIDGNDISNVEFPSGVHSASNGAAGIYTKATFCRVHNNHIRNIAVTATNTAADADQIIGINLKGLNRGSAGGPVGYGEISVGNTIVGVGGASIGVGMSCDHLGVIFSDNWIEDVGLVGISGAEGANPTSDSIKVLNNTVIMRATGGQTGISIYTSTGNNSVIGNTVNGGDGPCIRASASAAAYANGLIANNQLIGSAQGVYSSSETHAVTNLQVIGNQLVSGSHGFFANDGGGAFTSVSVLDNDFTAAATAGIGGTASRIASCRIRNNKGYVSENGGISGAIASGATIAHGLAVAPGNYNVTPVGAVTAITSVTADATNLTVNYSGGGTAAFAWEAKIPAYWS